MSTHTPEWEARARLVAAAPELAAVIEDEIAWHEEQIPGFESMGFTASVASHKQRITALRAIIKKARGQ